MHHAAWRTLSVITVVLAVLAAPPVACAQDLVRRLEPLWRACAIGDVGACRAAANFPLNAQGRRALQENLVRAQMQWQTFEQNWYQCHAGSADACDAALAYPLATGRDTLLLWRNTAIENARLERERREAEEHARAQAARSQPLAASTTPNSAAESNRSAVDRSLPAPFKPPPALTVAAFLILVLVWFAFLRKPGPLAPVSAIASLWTRLFRFSPPTAHQGTHTMFDDREQLATLPQPWAAARQYGSDPGPAPVMPPGHDGIRVKIRRGQITGITGRVTFSVNFIAELSPEAREAVRRYRFGKTVLYQKDLKLERTINVFRLLWRLFWLWLTRRRWQITVSDLVHGRTIECKEILEVLEVEQSIMAAARTFASVLRAASWFGGEEIVEL